MSCFKSVSMSSISKASRVLCTPLSIEHGLLVGIAMVLMSAAVWSDALEIMAGLVGTLVVCMMKKRTPQRRDKVAEPVVTPLGKCQANYTGSKSSRPKTNPRPPRSPLRYAEPKAPLTFADGMSIDEQVDQLLSNLMPSRQDFEVCEELKQHLLPPIRKLIPEAEIEVVAHNSIVSVGRTGLRPEVDLIVTASPSVLAQRLLMHMKYHPNDRSVRKFPKIAEAEEATLNKFAVRTVAAQLPFCPHWRTAYRGVEPKVVLLAPRGLGIVSEDIHIHVRVNCPNSLRANDVFNQSDGHVRKLIAFVRRWAQDRCISNPAYGHMPSYGWSLFVKYFCQSQAEDLLNKSTIEMFREFVDFYIKWYDSFIQTRDEVALQIEDPYEAHRNVAESMTPHGMKRFREELERAQRLVANNSSLDTILERCNPTLTGKCEDEGSMPLES